MMALIPFHYKIGDLAGSRLWANFVETIKQSHEKHTYYHLVLDKSGSMDSCWKEARQRKRS